MGLIDSRKSKWGMSAASALLLILFSGCNTPPSIEETVAALKNIQLVIGKCSEIHVPNYLEKMR